MGLFSKKKELTGGLLEGAVYKDAAADFYSTIEYLSGLSDDEYTKVIKCAEINRKATAKQCRVLGIPNEPTTLINHPELDTELGNFFTDQPKPKLKIQKSEKPKGKKGED